MIFSDDRVPESDALTPDITNSSSGDIEVIRNSMDILNDEHISAVPAQNEISPKFVNMGFYTEEPSTGSELERNIMASQMEENILEKDFRMLFSLGCGSFGEVKLACHLPTGIQVAVKVLEKNINSVANIISEVEILQSLEHRNIVRFFDLIDTLTTTYLIMEYVARQDLQKYVMALGCLKEEEARPVFQQVVSAVLFLHQRHVAHRDIKLENIMVDAARNAKPCDLVLQLKSQKGRCWRSPVAPYSIGPLRSWQGNPMMAWDLTC